MTTQLRIARPVTSLERSAVMYARGLGLRELGRFEDHQGFDGVMLGLPELPYHFELTRCRTHPVAPAPTAEDLVVLYLPDPPEWQRRCASMLYPGPFLQPVLAARRAHVRGSGRLPLRHSERGVVFADLKRAQGSPTTTSLIWTTGCRSV